MADGPTICPVCGTPGMAVIYDSGTSASLSSLCQILPGAKIVHYCRECGHLAGNGVANAASFYESDYRILLDDEDEDQIYETQGERIVARTDHQISVLKAKITLKPGLMVLDYGCAKAAMARKIIEIQPEIGIHLFDVSRMYEPFWDRFVGKDQQAVHDTPVSWDGHFDLITSFFAFEHITEPATAMAHIARLLKPGGKIYMIVPDVAGNAADFIVIDHVNHFTRTSAARLMTDAGFADVEIDAESHRGALVVTARKADCTPGIPGDAREKSGILEQAKALADFWSRAADAIRANESATDAAQSAAIYGSGFYGSFIHSKLERPEAVACYLDQSPWRIGKTLFEVPIVAPQDLPSEIETIYAGVNPAIAHGIMEAQPWFGREGLRIVYLEGVPR